MLSAPRSRPAPRSAEQHQRAPLTFRGRWLALLASSLAACVAIAWSWHLRTSSTLPFHHPLSPSSSTPATSSERRIPPFVHYVFGLSPDFGGKPFGLVHFVCFMSAVRKLRPEVVYMHHVYEPKGFYWDRVLHELAQEEVKAQTRLEMVKERDVVEIFGNKVEHFAHKADVLRLEALRSTGGIYLDMDVLVLRDLSSFYGQNTVMGMESQPNLDPSLPPSGLCNAVILSSPSSPFVRRWLNSYATFSAAEWARHSVSKPWELALSHPEEITVLNKYAFFYPLWHDPHLRLLHRSPRSSYDLSKPAPGSPTREQAFTVHLWESQAYERYLKPYDPVTVHFRGEHTGAERKEDGVGDETAFSREARQYVSQEMVRAWREYSREKQE